MRRTSLHLPAEQPSAAAPTSHRLAVEHATAFGRRHARQNVAVLVAAALLGLWLGTAAPSVSPAAPPAAAVSPVVIDQAPVDQTPVGRVAPFGPGGGRR